MKSKLKVGDKVYDSALFGNVEGEVIEITKKGSFPVVITFGNQNEYYTLDGRLREDMNPTLSMHPYDKLSDIVPVWEEEEVWGICWDFNSSPRYYGKIIKSTNAKYPYRIDGAGNFKNFKETGKLI